jgi:hypothetical protein
MAHKELVIALSLIVAASPLPAAQPEPDPMSGAPAASADAKYCMRVEPFTGSNIETVKCWTREQWAEQGVDVDKEWAKEGVAVKG